VCASMFWSVCHQAKERVLTAEPDASQTGDMVRVPAGSLTLIDFRVSIKHKYTIKHSLEWLLVISCVMCMHNEHSFDELCYVSFVDRICLFCVILTHTRHDYSCTQS
jgi:hypothetical protein